MNYISCRSGKTAGSPGPLISFTCRNCRSPIAASINGNNLCIPCRTGLYADEDRGRHLAACQEEREAERWERMR